MLGKGYIKLNGETIPNPTGLNISDQNFDSIKTSETGEDVGTTSRLRKQTFQFSFRSSSRGRDRIVHFCELSECTMSFNGVPKYGRLRITGEKLVPESERCQRTDGIWDLTVQFIEK